MSLGRVGSLSLPLRCLAVVRVVGVVGVVAALSSACDPPIALAGDTTLVVAVPLPVITAVDGDDDVPPLVATLEVPGFLGEVTLLPVDGLATGSFAFAVPEARTVAAIVRVSGALRAGADDAVLAVADLDVDVGPGLEAALDADDVAGAYVFAPSLARPWLDLNRNGLENRADYEAGCDPAVPPRFLGVSASDLQLPRDGDRAVVVVDNLLSRRVRLQVDVVDAPGVGVDVVGDAEASTSLAAIAPRVVEPGQSLLIAVSFTAANAFFSSGLLDVTAVDDVDDDACGDRLSVGVRVLANVGTPPRPAVVDAPLPPVVDVGGFPAALVTVPAAAVVAGGAPFVTALSALPSGRAVVVDGVTLPADAVFLVEIPRGGRLSAAVGAAPFDLDLSVLALDDDDKPVALLPRRADDVTAPAPLPAGSTETAEVRFDAAAGGRDIAAARVLVVVGASGATEPRLLDPSDRAADVAITLRTSTTPRLLSRAEPAFGPVDGGTTVTLLGESLRSTGVVFFGRAPAVCAAPVDAGAGRQRLSCTAPPGTLSVADNPVDVAYVSADEDGGERAALVDAFLYEPTAPRVDRVEPSIVVVGSGAALTLSGFGFTERYAPVQLTVGGVTVAVDVIDDRTLFAAAPDLAAGPKDLSVTVFDSGLQPLTASRTAAVLYVDDELPPPLLSAVIPGSGDVAGGTQLTLTGSGFAAGARVLFEGSDGPVAGSVVFVGATAVIALTPVGVVGVVDVTVENPDLQASTLAGAFTFTQAPTPPPQAFTIVPSTGTTAGGEQVTILGVGFDDPIVTFGGTPAVVVDVSASALVVVAPPRPAGLVDVVVSNADGQTDTVVGGYSVLAPVVLGPQVFSVSPQTGPLAGGTLVTLLGANFSRASVTIGGVAVALVDGSENALVFATPAHVAGAVDVVVENADAQTARVQGAFVYADPVVVARDPLVVTVSPDPAHAGVGGETLRLVGEHLEQTAGATVVAGALRLPATLTSVSANVVVVSVDAALPAGPLLVELVDAVAGVHSSPVFSARAAVPFDLSVSGRADEGSAFTLLISGSDLNPARLFGVRFTPLDAGSGLQTVFAPRFASESIVAVDAFDLGRGGWIVALVYREPDGDDVIVPVDVLEIGGFCPGARLCETCGDAVRDPGEACDGTDFDGETCALNGFDGGTLGCVGCQLDFNLCSQCGNGRREGAEQCDNVDLGGANCTNAGFTAGTLACSSTCSFDVSACRTCGDGVCSVGETSSNCGADCPATCGNGTCDVATESCSSCPRDCDLCAPYALLLLEGGGQRRAITQTLLTAITVRLVDDVGVGVPGVPITFGIEPGDATSDVDLIVVTNAGGEASVSWTMGPRVGLHTMNVSANPADGTVVGNQPLTVTATADDVAPGTIVRLAGGTGLTTVAVLGSGIRSRVLNPTGLAIDADGQPLFAEAFTGNAQLTRLRLPDGVFETLIPGGGPTSAAFGDGGPAINARFRNSSGLATRGREIFLVEGASTPESDRVRRIDEAGFISTVVGGGAVGQPGNGDGGPATAAHLEAVEQIGFDLDGNLVVIDNGTVSGNVRLHMRRVVDDVISTLSVPNRRVGTNFAPLSVLQGQTIKGPLQFFDDDLFALAIGSNTTNFSNTSLNICDATTNACMSTRGANIVQLARGPDGLIYSATTSTIERHDGLGGRTVVAGSTAGFSGDGGPATAAQLASIVGLGFNAQGDLFILESGNNDALRMVRGVAPPSTPAPTSFQIIDGDGQSGRVFGSPPQPVRVGLVTEQLVGEWPLVVVGETGGQSAQVTELVFVDPQNAAAVIPLIGRALGEQRWFVEPPLPLRRLLPPGDPVESFTVTATPLQDGDVVVVNSSPILIDLPTAPPIGPVIPASRLDFGSIQGSGTFNEPGISFRGSDVFIADAPLTVVWHLDASGAVRALAGTPDVVGNSGDGGAASAALVSRPAGTTVVGEGDVLFADPTVHRVRRVRAGDGVIVNAAGTGSTTAGGGNGTPATAAIVNQPRQVLGRPDGSFFLTDRRGVRFVDVDGIINEVIPDGTCLSGVIRSNSTVTSASLAFDAVNARVLTSLSVPFSATCPLANDRFHIMDITDGVLDPTPVFSEAVAGSNLKVASLAVHPLDGRVFIITATAPGNAATYAMREIVGETLVPVAGLPGTPYSMAFDDDGTLWVIDLLNAAIFQLRP